MLGVISYKEKGKRMYQIDRFIIVEKELSYTKNRNKTKASNKRKSPYEKPPITKPPNVKIEGKSNVEEKLNREQTRTPHYNEEVKDTRNEVARSNYIYMTNRYPYSYIK
jgi:hypothetical protein